MNKTTENEAGPLSAVVKNLDLDSENEDERDDEDEKRRNGT